MNKSGGQANWRKIMFLFAVILLSASFFYIKFIKTETVGYLAPQEFKEDLLAQAEDFKPEIPKRKVVHVETPTSVKAVYMSSWVAGTPSFRNQIIELIDSTELNAVVIDVKDSTGVISFPMDDPLVKSYEPFENRIRDVENLIDTLHEKNIYIIARVTVFQDPLLASKRNDIAPFRKSTGGLWKDRKGLAWVETGSTEVWEYNVAVAKYAYKIGFDEINFDYIRFPSDGDMNDIGYRFYDPATTTKAEKLREFFEYLHGEMKAIGAPISADFFGMTMTNKDDLNIGQVLENAIPYFDFIAPMVYPSHYPTGFHNYKNPASVPYEIIRISMDEGVKRAISASSTPNKLRPWLQDFNLGATYTAEMVRAQIQATYDAGLNSWMLWDPSNKYTRGALLE